MSSGHDLGDGVMPEAELCVPLARTLTARQTVDYAVDIAGNGTVHFVVALSAERGTPEGDAERERARELLDQARAWAHEDMGRDSELTIHTDILGEEGYLFGPEDYADTLGRYAADHGIDRVIIDPEYWVDSVGPMLASFEATLEATGVTVEEAPVHRPARHERLTSAPSPVKMVTLFFISYGFYLVLGDPTYWFDLLTGAAAAGLVAVTLGNVTFARPPQYPGSIYRTARFAAYVPYLTAEIIRANIAIAIVILHPRLPIDPAMTRIDAKVAGGLPLLALANSITLTPGTLTVRANDQRLLVHTLIRDARTDLFGGRLERAVRFVFYGRRYARIPTPEERGDAEIIRPGERE